MPADVVISGAGPNGLMMACELALAGVKPVVLDALPRPGDEPKANGLVGQVIRQLDMRGLYQAFTGDPNAPQPAYGWMFSGLPLNFVGVEANPMRALLMKQPRLVQLLYERAQALGVEVRWGHAVTALSAGRDGVTVDVAAPDGPYVLQADWLVGADGGRSTVRKQSGIGFPGHTSPTVARLAHVHIADEFRTADGALDVPGFGRVPFGHNRYDTGMVIFFEAHGDPPMLGTLEFGSLPDGAPGELTYDELRQSLRRVLGVDVPFDLPTGPGPFAMRRIDGQNTRQADAYRSGRILLIGDAAHVHSAMGGPGLNLGLQDTLNLGWKLAAVINGWAPEALIDTYESERYPVGERVMMHSLAQIALTAPGPEVRALRTLLGELFQLPDATAHMAGLLAGADVRYEMGGTTHRLTGFMVPDEKLDDGRRLTDLLHSGRGVVLDLSGGAAAAVVAPWDRRVDTVEAAMADGPAAMLIRPDGYVAWAADTFAAADAGDLRAALERWFGPVEISD
ncbi:FAD-dependent monooxygenase [Mycobacterium sp. SM3041]|uniref:FAD-dependent monooxygenase n=1 Tax=Mycobacterium sp. SM3041 TaxID=3114291 RepID=UPI003204DF92